MRSSSIRCSSIRVSVFDLSLGLGLQGEIVLLLLLEVLLLVDEGLVVGLEIGAQAVVLVHHVGGGVRRHADEDVGLQLLARFTKIGEQGDARRPARQEAVHGDLFDLRRQRVDLPLQLGLLGLQRDHLIGELLEFGLGLEELGGRLVGAVLGILDLGRRPLRSLLVRTGDRSRCARHDDRDEADQSPDQKGAPASHGRAPYRNMTIL